MMSSKIYTRVGDQGETALIGGIKVIKSHPRIKAIGAVDELNAVLGYVRSINSNGEAEGILERVQNDLFQLGESLATITDSRQKGQSSRFDFGAETSFFEKEIDRFSQDLEPLKSFILPGGVVPAAALHWARTVCRRAEREIVSLKENEEIVDGLIGFINRLSDFLFVLARWANLKNGGKERIWLKKIGDRR